MNYHPIMHRKHFRVTLKSWHPWRVIRTEKLPIFKDKILSCIYTVAETGTLFILWITRFRNLNLNHQEPNEKKKMRLSVHSVVLSCHLFLSPFTLSHSKYVSILVLNYEIMKMLRNGHIFYYFLSLIHYDSACQETYTIKWPLKSGFTAYVMFKTLSNMLTALSQLFQHWYTMSTWITQSINFSKSKRDDNDDLVRYDIWF